MHFFFFVICFMLPRERRHGRELRDLPCGSCILILGFPPVTPAKVTEKITLFRETFFLFCVFFPLLPREGIEGKDWGIYRGTCTLIPDFPPVTPSQGSRKSHIVQRRSVFHLFCMIQLFFLNATLGRRYGRGLGGLPW